MKLGKPQNKKIALQDNQNLIWKPKMAKLLINLKIYKDNIQLLVNFKERLLKPAKDTVMHLMIWIEQTKK